MTRSIVCLYLDDDLIKELDQLRENFSRSPYVQYTLKNALKSKIKP
jgi:hypothetical protein